MTYLMEIRVFLSSRAGLTSW